MLCCKHDRKTMLLTHPCNVLASAFVRNRRRRNHKFTFFRHEQCNPTKPFRTVLYLGNEIVNGLSCKSFSDYRHLDIPAHRLPISHLSVNHTRLNILAMPNKIFICHTAT